MINFKKKKILILIFSIIIIFFAKIFLYDNPRALYVIVEGLDDPSSIYYYFVKKIYSLSAKESEVNRLIEELESGKNEYLHYLYLRTLGIVGQTKNRANYVLIKIYSKFQDNENKKMIVYSAVDSMGFVGDESTISILERILENYENHKMVVSKYPIARALYLSTGDVQKVKKKSKLDFTATEELKLARKIINRSKGRYRTLNEMLFLDNLNRPENFKFEKRNVSK